MHCRISSSQSTPSMHRCIEWCWWAEQPCWQAKVISSPQAPLSSKGCSARTRARRSSPPTTIPRQWATAGCGVGRRVVCSKQWLGGGLGCSGVTTLLGPGYPPEASMTRTILRNELNCQSHRHHHHRLQQSVHSDNNGSFGSNTHVRGAIPLHMPPGRTTVEDLIRVPSHGLSHAAGLQHGSPTTGDKAHTSPPTQGAFTHMYLYGVPGAAS